MIPSPTSGHDERFTALVQAYRSAAKVPKAFRGLTEGHQRVAAGTVPLPGQSVVRRRPFQRGVGGVEHRDLMGALRPHMGRWMSTGRCMGHATHRPPPPPSGGASVPKGLNGAFALP